MTPSTDESRVTYRVASGVAYIELNRPESKNAMRVADRMALADSLRRADVDQAVRAVVLSGAGDTFCAGGDIREFGACTDVETSLAYGRHMAQVVFRTLRSISVPTIARVQGAAIGAGMFLALGCDVVVAADDAYFLTKYLKLGVPPDWGAMWMLPRLVGLARAKQILLTGRKIPASTALTWGLIAECAPLSRLDSVIAGYVEDFCEVPRGALELARRGIDTSFDTGLDAFLNYELAGIAATAAGEEHHRRYAQILEALQRPTQEGER